MSIVEMDSSSIGHALRSSMMDTSVGESGIMDEPEIHDLLEIGRFSMDTNNQAVQSIKRREIKTQEDLDDLLSLLSHKAVTSSSHPFELRDVLSSIVTL